MTPDEKPQFLKLLSMLFGAHGKTLGESMIAGYWKGLEKMSLTAFERCCDKAIEKLQYCERGVSKTPTVSELWDIKRGFLGRIPAETEKQPEWVGDAWDTAANLLLLTYITNNWKKRKEDRIDYAPDSSDCIPLKTGPHTDAIAKILRRYAKAWANNRRLDEAEGVKTDGKAEWFSLMGQADKEVSNYLSQMRAAA